MSNNRVWEIRETLGMRGTKAWMVVRIENGRELKTFMVYGRRKDATRKAAELNLSF
jgi:hypothetical protein